MMASSSFMPPVRTVWAETMPFIDTTAASLQPPPRSTTMLPVGVDTGRSAPKAPASGSGIRKASRAPACSVASCTARLSTLVTP